MNKKKEEVKRIVILVIGSLCFILAVFFNYFGVITISGTGVNPRISERSIIGNTGLTQLIHRLGMDKPVFPTREDTGNESLEQDVALTQNVELLYNVNEVSKPSSTISQRIFVLPKWESEPHDGNPQWAKKVMAISPKRVEKQISRWGLEGRVVRPKDVKLKQTTVFTDFKANLFAPQFLVHDEWITPVVHYNKGILVGYVEDPSKNLDRIWLISDPDLFNNLGLTRGNNAKLAIQLLNHIRGDSALVLPSEARVSRVRSFMWAFLRFPWLMGPITLLLTALVFYWASRQRFGFTDKPLSSTGHGRHKLVVNAARLILAAKRDADILKAYFEAGLYGVAWKYHLPRDQSDAALVDQLNTIELRKTGRSRLAALRRDVGAVMPGDPKIEMVGIAARIHKWKREMLDGI